MRPGVRLSLLLAVVLAAPAVAVRTQVGAPSSAPANQAERIQTVLAALDAQLPAEFAKDGVGGASIAVVSGGVLVWSRHYGYADMDTRRVPTNDTAYRIGSITKQFTALALLQAAEAKVLRVNDPVEKYVPEIQSVKGGVSGAAPITLIQLAMMTSGLAREPGCSQHSVGPVGGWQKIVADCLPATTYANPPGTTYLYSNIGYATLGLAVERARSRPFTQLVTDDILVPLGMTRSAFEPSPELRRDLAHGYTRVSGAPSRARADAELEGRGYRVPNGALFSTVADLAKFVAWQLGSGPELIPRAVQDSNYGRAFFYNQALSSGYGVGFMVTRRGDVVMLGHGGSTAGYRAAALFHRPSRLGVIMLRNAEGGSFDAGPVGFRVLERLVAGK